MYKTLVTHNHTQRESLHIITVNLYVYFSFYIVYFVDILMLYIVMCAQQFIKRKPILIYLLLV